MSSHHVASFIVGLSKWLYEQAYEFARKVDYQVYCANCKQPGPLFEAQAMKPFCKNCRLLVWAQLSFTPKKESYYEKPQSAND